MNIQNTIMAMMIPWSLNTTEPLVRAPAPQEYGPICQVSVIKDNFDERDSEVIFKGVVPLKKFIYIGRDKKVSIRDNYDPRDNEQFEIYWLGMSPDMSRSIVGQMKTSLTIINPTSSVVIVDPVQKIALTCTFTSAGNGE